MTLHGLERLELASVAAVVVGFTPSLTYMDVALASLLLAEPGTMFLLEAPDATCRATTDQGRPVTIPCTCSTPGWWWLWWT